MEGTSTALQIVVDNSDAVGSHDSDAVWRCCAGGGASEVGRDEVTWLLMDDALLDGAGMKGLMVLDNGRMIYGGCRRFRRVRSLG